MTDDQKRFELAKAAMQVLLLAKIPPNPDGVDFPLLAWPKDSDRVEWHDDMLRYDIAQLSVEMADAMLITLDPENARFPEMRCWNCFAPATIFRDRRFVCAECHKELRSSKNKNGSGNLATPGPANERLQCDG